VGSDEGGEDDRQMGHGVNHLYRVELVFEHPIMTADTPRSSFA